MLFFFFFFILRRMGKNKAVAHHTSPYFYTRRVSIELSCFRSPTLAGAPFGSMVWYLYETQKKHVVGGEIEY